MFIGTTAMRKKMRKLTALAVRIWIWTLPMALFLITHLGISVQAGKRVERLNPLLAPATQFQTQILPEAMYLGSVKGIPAPLYNFLPQQPTNLIQQQNPAQAATLPPSLPYLQTDQYISQPPSFDPSLQALMHPQNAVYNDDNEKEETLLGKILKPLNYLDDLLIQKKHEWKDALDNVNSEEGGDSLFNFRNSNDWFHFLKNKDKEKEKNGRNVVIVQMPTQQAPMMQQNQIEYLPQFPPQLPPPQPPLVMPQPVQVQITSSPQPSVEILEEKIIHTRSKPGHHRPAVWECPSHSVDTGMECVIFERENAQMHCPVEGFTPYHGLCIIVDTQVPTQGCPQDFQLEPGNMCVKTRRLSKKHICQPDYSLSGGDCRRGVTIRPSVFCPSGLALRGQRCYGHSTQMPNFDCPPGMTIDGQMCYSYDVAQPISACQPNSQSVNGHCQATLAIPAQMRCPSGYKQEGHQCAGVTSTAPTLSCLSGHLEGNRCVTIEHELPILICPGGTLNGSECLIETIEPQILVCPSGSKPDIYGKCGSIGHSKYSYATAQCPPEFHGSKSKEGKCVKIDVMQAHYNCASGFQMTAYQECEKKVYQNPEAICSPGSAFSGHQCICKTVVQPEMECHNGFHLDYHSKQCIKEELTTPLNSCPGGYELHGGHCKRKIVQNVRTSCPPSYELRGHLCVSEEESYPNYECRQAYILDNTSGMEPTCRGQDIVPAMVSCPDGFTETGNDCVEKETLTPSRVCALNYQLIGDRCECKREVKPIPWCRAGFNFVDAECVRKTTVPREPRCPDSHYLANDRTCRRLNDDYEPIAAAPHMSGAPLPTSSTTVTTAAPMTFIQFNRTDEKSSSISGVIDGKDLFSNRAVQRTPIPKYDRTSPTPPDTTTSTIPPPIYPPMMPPFIYLPPPPPPVVVQKSKKKKYA